MTNLLGYASAIPESTGKLLGMTSGVAEMLLQSNMGYINMLPALPDAWASGSVSGLVARGNFEVSMNWKNKHLTSAVDSFK